MNAYKLMLRHIGWSQSQWLYSEDASLRFDPRIVHRGCAGDCSTIGWVSISGFWFNIPTLSNSHSHWILAWYPACVICYNRDIVRSYRSASVSPLIVLTSRNGWQVWPCQKQPKLLNFVRFGAVPICAIFREFGLSVFASVSSMHYPTTIRFFHMQ